MSYLDRVVSAIERDNLSPLMSTVLGLKKEHPLKLEDIQMLPDESYYNKDLVRNPAQKQAVALARSMDGINNTLTIVQGPPGTGKTTPYKGDSPPILLRR